MNITFIEIWEASYGETFHCMRETGNSFDSFAVAVVRDGANNRPRAKVNFSCFFSVSAPGASVVEGTLKNY